MAHGSVRAETDGRPSSPGHSGSAAAQLTRGSGSPAGAAAASNPCHTCLRKSLVCQERPKAFLLLLWPGKKDALLPGPGEDCTRDTNFLRVSGLRKHKGKKSSCLKHSPRLVRPSVHSLLSVFFKISPSKLPSRHAFASSNIFSCFLGFFFLRVIIHLLDGLFPSHLSFLEKKKCICLNNELHSLAWACADVRSLRRGKRRHGGPAPGPFSEVHAPLPPGKGSALRGGGSSRGLALGLSQSCCSLCCSDAALPGARASACVRMCNERDGG